jgi:CRP-like cAMP-binding protein
MPRTQAYPYKNQILSALPKRELASLTARLSAVDLPLRTSLQAANEQERYAYFLEDGMASIVSTMADGSSVEVGAVGRDGVVGISALLEAKSSPMDTFVQIAGSGFRISAKQLKEAFEQPGKLRTLLQRYIQLQLLCARQFTACNRLHSAEQRLARWLLTCQDIVGSDELRLKQEFLGQMLGIRRLTVTISAGQLQGAGLIDYARGRIRIKDRAGLEKTACECYELTRADSRVR